MNKLLILLMFGFLFHSTKSMAETDANQYDHDWAHLGTSFALQTISYGLVKSLEPNMDKTEALILSGLLTFGLTFSYEMLKVPTTGNLDTHTVLMNGIGQGVGIGTMLIFNF